MDDPSCEKEILANMVANLINVKVEFVPWFKSWFVNLFGYVFSKMKALEWPLSKNEIVAYMVTCYSVNIKYCGWPLLRKRDISLYGCKFDKCEGWISPLI